MLHVLYLSSSNFQLYPQQKILPLYGEQTYPGSRQWKYYTGSDGYHSIKLPITNGNKHCQDSYGCDEIYDGNVVKVKGHDSGFKANIYKQQLSECKNSLSTSKYIIF